MEGFTNGQLMELDFDQLSAELQSTFGDAFYGSFLRVTVIKKDGAFHIKIGHRVHSLLIKTFEHGVLPHLCPPREADFLMNFNGVFGQPVEVWKEHGGVSAWWKAIVHRDNVVTYRNTFGNQLPVSEAVERLCIRLPIVPSPVASITEPVSPVIAAPVIAAPVIAAPVIAAPVIEPAVIEPAVVDPAVIEPAVVDPEPAVVDPEPAVESDAFFDEADDSDSFIDLADFSSVATTPVESFERRRGGIFRTPPAAAKNKRSRSEEEELSDAVNILNDLESTEGKKSVTNGKKTLITEENMTSIKVKGPLQDGLLWERDIGNLNEEVLFSGDKKTFIITARVCKSNGEVIYLSNKRYCKLYEEISKVYGGGSQNTFYNSDAALFDKVFLRRQTFAPFLKFDTKRRGKKYVYNSDFSDKTRTKRSKRIVSEESDGPLDRDAERCLLWTCRIGPNPANKLLVHFSANRETKVITAEFVSEGRVMFMSNTRYKDLHKDIGVTYAGCSSKSARSDKQLFGAQFPGEPSKYSMFLKT